MYGPIEAEPKAKKVIQRAERAKDPTTRQVEAQKVPHAPKPPSQHLLTYIFTQS